MPKVSVILPNYNHKKYLKKRIESIYNQTFKDWEMIILDDASTDGSIELLKDIATDPRVKEITFNSKNSGSTFIQWEKGIRMASGAYIWIAESDDYAEPEFLARALEELECQPKLGIVYSPSIWINAAEEIIHIPDFEEGAAEWEGHELLSGAFLTGNPIYNASSAVFRKNLTPHIDFEQLRSLRYVGDWLFWVQISFHTRVKRLGTRMNYFRRHDENVSFRSDLDGLQFLEGIRVLNYIFENHTLSFIQKRKALLRWARKISHSTVSKKADVLKQMSREIRFYARVMDYIKL